MAYNYNIYSLFLHIFYKLIFQILFDSKIYVYYTKVPLIIVLNLLYLPYTSIDILPDQLKLSHSTNLILESI